MKLLLLTTFIATVCYVNAGKTQRLLAALAMNGGLANGAIPGMIAGGGLNPPIVGAGGGTGFVGQPQFAQTQRLLAALAMNGGLANGAIPGMIAGGGLNPPMVGAGGGAGFVGQPQFFPRVPAFAVPAPVPNVYTGPAVNSVPFMGVPEMAQMNPPQQPLMGIPGGVMQQQLPFQLAPLRRFRRQLVKQDNTLKTTADTQIPAPTETMTTTPCDKEGHHEDY